MSIIKDKNKPIFATVATGHATGLFYAYYQDGVECTERRRMGMWRQSQTMAVCIDAWTDSGYAGKLYPSADDAPVPFDDVDRLLLTIEKLLDMRHYPEASTEPRLFGKRERGSNLEEEMRVSAQAKGQDKTGAKGGKATFLIQIQYRQHATWQGSLVWVEQEKEQRFRSALELIRLLDSATETMEL
jgi:hypothetical protein